MHRDPLVEKAVQQICEVAAETGEITFDQINELLPSTQFTAEQIEELLKRLSAKEIQIVEN
jgi:RNA polymerase primary sigma factor